MIRAHRKRAPETAQRANSDGPSRRSSRGLGARSDHRGDVLRRQSGLFEAPRARLNGSMPALGARKWHGARVNFPLCFRGLCARALVRAAGGEPGEDRHGRVPSNDARAVRRPRRRARHAEAARQVPSGPHPTHPIMGARDQEHPTSRRRPQGRVRSLWKMPRRLRHQAIASPKMNVAAGIAVMVSSFCAVAGDGLQMRRRRRDTWTRLTPSF